MKVFGSPISTCTRKVLTTLHEKHAPFEFHHVDLAKGAHKSADHMTRQPFGQVPALEDGDFRLFESRAMIRYIDQTVPGQALTPADAKGRALMEQWISVETSDFTPHAMTIIMQCIFAPMAGAQPDEAKVQEGRTKIAPALQVLEKQLARGPHLLGEPFTLADICYMPYIEYLSQTPAKDLITSHPHVAAWWKRISERPSWKEVTRKA